VAKLISSAITTLDTASSARTRIEREFDPEAVRQLKAAGRDLSVGGPDLAVQAISAGGVVYLRDRTRT
jgi:hypothetical protein